MYTHHYIGKMILSISNFGMWGDSIWDWPDAFTGERREIGSEYPKGSFIYSLYHANFWAGGILNGDTLVSIGTGCYPYTAYELTPDAEPFGGIERRTTTDPSSPGYDEAVSEQDFIAVYADTFILQDATPDFLRGTLHKPLNIQVTQKSYAWSHALADDFVLFDMSIENTGNSTIEDFYFAIWSRPMVGFNFDFG